MCNINSIFVKNCLSVSFITIDGPPHNISYTRSMFTIYMFNQFFFTTFFFTNQTFFSFVHIAIKGNGLAHNYINSNSKKTRLTFSRYYWKVITYTFSKFSIVITITRVYCPIGGEIKVREIVIESVV